MKPRRTLTLIVLALALLAAALAVGAQQPGGGVYRIGFLSYFGCDASLPADGPFRRAFTSIRFSRAPSPPTCPSRGHPVVERRAFIAGGLALLAAPLAAQGQPAGTFTE